ncbi:T-cell immunoreceptor with Ig and ITIM domains isoform X2 [Ochotona princeps]|uniref:T-cell immunoreceptor with Ig and ITIM domains isoform X2 n=1 Tax=Ochotona princeps TaxID=9978 RepID=UPI0027152D21|nr:T-cell immunoreceptor with Ig and ITIM domains isoform X2 [Ochotona princeps]
MRWCFLLIWAQGLRQAPLLTSGMIVTAGNLSAEEGGSAILQCHLSSITAEVTQVNWEQQDQLVAIRHADFGWHVSSAFRERVVPGPNLGLTLLSLTANDTGEYFCIYHTYPHGIYKGRIFLEVRGSSVAEQSIGFQIPLLAALATLLVVLCVAVVGVVALAGKKQPLQMHSAENDPRQTPTEQVERHPSAPSSPGSCDPAATAPADLYTEQRGDDYDEPHDYFNVLSYRSLGNIGFLTETG